MSDEDEDEDKGDYDEDLAKDGLADANTVGEGDGGNHVGEVELGEVANRREGCSWWVKYVDLGELSSKPVQFRLWVSLERLLLWEGKFYSISWVKS